MKWYAKSNYGGYFYLGWNLNDDDPQEINGAIDVSASLLPLVSISVSEAELGRTFYNAIRGKILRLTLEEMGWKQGPTMIFVDNSTVSVICNSTIKQQQLRSDERPIFLVNRSGNLEHLTNKMGTRTRKYVKLFHKTFRDSSPS